MNRRALFLVVLFACQSEDPIPSGRLDRPSGIAVVPRPSEDDRVREDLLIADSEAQGLKVQQHLEGVGNGFFLPAPAVFFPLAVPAAGFPTEISASLADPHERVYVLAPGANRLHVLDVRPLFFGASVVDSDGYVSNGVIDLAVEVGDGLVPTDVEVVATTESVDVVAVAFSGIGVTDALALLTVDGTTASVTQMDRIDVLPAPRGVAVIGAGSSNVSVVVSSAASNSVLEVVVDPAGTFGAARMIDVSGPTQSIVAARTGALAVRIDRPALVHLIAGANGLERSVMPDNSPFTPIEERGTDAARGVIDMFDSPIGAAAFGSLDDGVPIVDPSRIAASFTGFEDDRLSGDARTVPGEQVAVAHLDGTITIASINGDRAELVRASTAAVARITRLSGGDVRVLECSGGGQPDPTCNDTGTLGACAPGVVAFDFPFYQEYRAVYQGTIVRSQTPRFTRVDTATTVVYRITDPSVSSYEERLVAVGDRVPTQVQSYVCGDDIEVEDLSVEGRVIAVSVDAIDVTYPDGFAVVGNCDGDVGPARAQRYEVRPSVRDVVLTRVTGERIIEVLERAAVSRSNGSEQAVFDQAVAFTMVTSSTFACTSGSLPCAIDADCGSGRLCEDRVGAVESCPRFCEEVCTETAEACLETLGTEVCSSLELEVLPTVPLVPIDAAQNVRAPLAAPASMAFSSLRQGWFVSFPGSRAIAEYSLVQGSDQDSSRFLGLGVIR